MRKHLLLISLMALLLACLYLPGGTPHPLPTKTPWSTATASPTPEPPLPPSPPAIDWADRSLFSPALRESQQSALESLPPLSIYNLVLVLDEDMQHLTGLEEIYYTNNEGMPLDSLWLGLFPEILGGQIEIGSVRLDGASVTPERSTGMLRIPLDPPLEAGAARLLSIEFSVTIPSHGSDYYYGIFGYNEGVLSLAHAYPTVLVYDQQGWNNALPDTDGDPLFSDAAFYYVTVDAPANQVLVASGVEIDRSQTGSRQTVRYVNGPGRDFYLAASPNFRRISATENDVTIHSYYLAGASQSAAQSALETARASIAIFSDLFIPYPYTEFDIVPISTSAGGVEYPGLTAVNLSYYYGNDPFLEEVVTHEVGHQWFYNLVGNDTQDEPYLDESLTQYNTCLYYAQRYGPSSGETCLNNLRFYSSLASEPGLPIGLAVNQYTSQDYVAIIYGKGAFFFDALQQRLGEAAYQALMRDYSQAFAWGIGYTADFQALAEQHCNCDLDDLFEEWVHP
ncbi:MAG: M1 family metallopeptidase [Anaerolineales bacterium]